MRKSKWYQCFLGQYILDLRPNNMFSESFELPSEKHQKRAKISTTVIAFVNSADESERRSVEVADETWLRIAQSFDPFE